MALHDPPPLDARRFAVLIMRPTHRDQYDVNRSGIEPLRAALARRGMPAAVLDMSAANAVWQLIAWLDTGHVSFVYGQGGWGADIWTRSGATERSIFDHYEVPYLARVAIPPFSASVSMTMTTRIRRGTILLGDRDALDLALRFAPKDVSVVHFPSVFAGFAHGLSNILETRSSGAANPRHAGLIVMTIEPPDALRKRWRDLYPGQADFLDDLVERAEACPDIPFSGIVGDMTRDTGVDPWARKDEAFGMLSLANKFLAVRHKLRLLRRAARFPFRFILAGDPGRLEFHDHAEVTGPVSARRLVSIHATCKAAISGNPANMSGAVSERIPMALRAGSAIVHAKNSILAEMFEPGRHYLEYTSRDDDIDRVCDIVASGGVPDGMRDAFLEEFTRKLGPDAMVARLLRLADAVAD